MKKFILSLLLMLPMVGHAFIVNNNTDATINIKVTNDHWWFSHTKTIGPHVHDYVYTICAEPKAYSYFTIQVQTPMDQPNLKDTWKIFTHSDVDLEFSLSDNGQLQIFADQAQIW